MELSGASRIHFSLPLMRRTVLTSVNVGSQSSTASVAWGRASEACLLLDRGPPSRPSSSSILTTSSMERFWDSRAPSRFERHCRCWHSCLLLPFLFLTNRLSFPSPFPWIVNKIQLSKKRTLDDQMKPIMVERKHGRGPPKINEQKGETVGNGNGALTF